MGDPVTAEDEDANDVLTYTLVDASENFVINRATGQISVATNAKFNHDGDDDITGIAEDSYTVNVVVTDPTDVPPDGVPGEADITAAGAYDTVEVTINVTQVDEPPIFTVSVDGSTNVAKVVAVPFEEGGDIATALATFMAMDAEDGDLDSGATRGIRGADSSKFDFNTETGLLTFEAAPDFEKPADADKDNVYEVTITAADGNANMSTKDIKVTVTNAEEIGEVELTQPRPRVGLAITAEYSDPDSGLSSVEWQWWRTQSNVDGLTRPVLAEEGEDFEFDPTMELEALDDNVWEMIEGATSASYTPVEDDAGDETGKSEASDVGRYLVAVVSYTDAKQNVAEVPKDMARLVSANPVARDTRNRAPVFKDQDDDTPGTQNQTATREVAENTKGNVGSAVIAEDPDPNADPLIYELSGADESLFTVDSAGQIKVKSGTKLDYETRTTYMVTLTAIDSFSDSASIDVTITVTDVDEAPKISEGGLAIAGPASVSYAEDRRDAVATYSATGPESANASWTLSGDDAGDFDISSSGELTFVSAPDYENAADADGDNEYLVTVEADDGTYTATRDVTVTVTDVVEDAPPVTDGTLLDKFDTNPQNGQIDKAEVVDAIIAFVTPGASDKPSKKDIVDLIVHFVTTPR